MNKIEVKSKSEIINEIEDKVAIKIDNESLIINVNDILRDPIILLNNIYQNVFVILENNAMATIFEIKDDKTKELFKYKYVLGDNSKAIINKFYYTGDYSEDVIIDLNGNSANILFHLNTMSFDNQKYNIRINHNNKKTISNVYNHGVSWGEGALDFVVTGVVKNGMSDSVLNQDNKIMTMGSGNNSIKPNLLIEENMVEAKHGASIGRFNDDEIFYLGTRGIPSKEGYHLLIKGFLLGNLKLDKDMELELSNIIEKFGR